MAKKPPTQAESDHMGRVAALGCVVCRNEELGETPAEVHHVEPYKGRDHFKTVPFCVIHHRLGGQGHLAVHDGRQSFEARYGTELALLEQVNGELGI